MTRLLSKAFRSLKPPSSNSNNFLSPQRSKKLEQHPSKLSIQSSSRKPSPSNSPSISRSSSQNSWAVYLILSTNPPIKTYVGVTNNFSRRLKQHNGELKGGAKAARAGRPWISACIVQGFKNKSTACEFESKWKISSRKLPRRKKNCNNEEETDNSHLLLLQHRYAALKQVMYLIDCSHLQIDWHLDPK